MQHSQIDKYSNLSSPIHKLDPRIKIISFMTFIIFILFTPPENLWQFFFYLIIIFTIVLLSKIPPLFIAKRMILILPFIFLIAVFIPFFTQGKVAWSYNLFFIHLKITYHGIWILWNIVAKSILSFLCLIIISSTTKFSDLLKGLEKLKFPRIMIMLISFMYRYIYTLIDELMSMKRARDSRSPGKDSFLKIKDYGHLLGVLFIKSYERSERVYLSMLSRGFEQNINILNPLYITAYDLIFLMMMISLLIIIRFFIVW